MHLELSILENTLSKRAGNFMFVFKRVHAGMSNLTGGVSNLTGGVLITSAYHHLYLHNLI